MATKEQRELAKIYCSLTDLRDAMDKLRLKLVDSKSLKTRDFKSVKESRKPEQEFKIHKYRPRSFRIGEGNG